MVGSALQRTLASKNRDKSLSSIPEKFTLNTGHVKFFYNKGEYLHKRYDAIVEEMKRRGMNPNPERKFKREQWPDELYNCLLYTSPSPRDGLLSRMPSSA